MPPKPPADDGHISDGELHQRVLYAFVQASARLATTFGLPLKSLERATHMAAFHVLRAHGLDLNRIAARLGVSRRKADQLSRQLKDNFFDRFTADATGEALQRRLEFMLWAEPLTPSRLRQVIDEAEPDQVDAALGQLLEAGRVERIPGSRRFRITTPQRRLVRDHWLARIDGLNHQLSAVAGAAFGRFFRDDPRAFARTVSLRVPAHRVAALEALYRDHIWPTLVALDAESEGLDADAIEAMTVSLCWAPDDALPADADGPEITDTEETDR